jgi:UDP-N-acetylmuramoylalanine--D-glutamate ligase
LEPTLAQLRDRPVEFVLGEHRAADFANADLVVRNPGVPRESRFLQIAREHGVPIRMELGLFFEQLPRGATQVIGITGTKGKTTTTLMTGAILQRANPKTVIAGNLRVSALELLDAIDADTTVVLEMSSFQLEEFEELRQSPHIAALTNLYPDHLNRYRDLNDYARAKAQIFIHQSPRDDVILNFDNPLSTRLRPKAVGRVVWFSRTRALNDGALLERDWLVWNEHGTRERIVLAAAVLAGEHNLENALAALAITKTWGAPGEIIREALQAFRGVPYRLELVRERNGVRYINDTTATAPTATVAALKTLAPRGGQLYLIAGGSDKGLPYAEMARAIGETRTRVILLAGSATENLERALEAAGAAELVCAHVASLGDAIRAGERMAGAGDTVLLSPGAASFGMFANEFERGDQFREIVNAL